MYQHDFMYTSVACVESWPSEAVRAVVVGLAVGPIALLAIVVYVERWQGHWRVVAPRAYGCAAMRTALAGS